MARKFTFAEVVVALARIHSLSPSGEKALRARLQHFQRIGLVSLSPGKGKKIEYSLNDVLWWAFALELSQFGVEPVFTKRLLDLEPRPVVWLTVHTSPLYFFHPVFMGRYITDDAARPQTMSVFHFVGKSIDDVEKHVEEMGVAPDDFRQRYGVVDLLRLFTSVVEALGIQGPERL